MSLRTIEIICTPCPKCDEAERKIKQVIKVLEWENKTKYVYDFKKTTDLRQAQKYSANVTLAPFIIVNGALEWTGKIPNIELIKIKIRDIIRY